MQIVKYIFGILILFFTFWYTTNAISGFNYSNDKSTVSSKKDLELVLEKAIIEKTSYN